MLTGSLTAMRVSKLVQTTANAYPRGEIKTKSVSLYYIVFIYWVTGQIMSDVLFFVSCIEIIVCMFAGQITFN